jgi:L-amino acid N-acyltransferase YncA
MCLSSFTYLVVRISRSNQPSIKLFLQLGFAVVRVVEVFDEVEMRMIECAN